MPDPKGKIIVICGFRDDGSLHAIELSDADSLKVYVEGGEITVTAHALLDGTVNNDTVANAPTRGSIIVGNDTLKWDELVLGADKTIVSSDGTDVLFRTKAELGIVDFYSGYIHINDEKAQNTGGGTFTLGAWRTRDLNQEKSDTGDNASLASNQITLDAGTYRCMAAAPAYNIDRHQTRLYNITDSAVLLTGTSVYAPAGHDGANTSYVYGRFTIAAEKVIELQHQSEATQADLGLGIASNFGIEVYASVELWKEA